LYRDIYAADIYCFNSFFLIITLLPSPVVWISSGLNLSGSLYFFQSIASLGLLSSLVAGKFLDGYMSLGRDDVAFPVVERLASLDYIDYVESESTVSGDGVVYYDERLSQPGFNLFTYKAADKIFLMSMDGEILHELDISKSCNLSYFIEYDDDGFIVICESKDLLGKGLMKL
jgi:hypothetical protein